MGETITASTRVDYLPISTAFESVTIYWYDSGTLHKLAGARGTVMVKWYDGNRYKFAIGYVGESGIKPGTAYRADESGKLVELAA